jgi:Restriction endonuclease
MMLAEESLSDDDLLADESLPRRDLKSVDTVVDTILARDGRWRRGSRIDLGDLAWRPHLIMDQGNAVLHVHLADRLRPHLFDRLAAARAAGHEVHVALMFEALYDGEAIVRLGSVDAYVHLITDNGTVDQKPEHILALLADQGVPVPIDARRELAQHAWERRTEGTAFHRGRRFEGLLSLLLSQVSDFRIRERNFRGETDELDIVIQLDRISTRCWYESGVPFILVEAKNWSVRVDQKEVSAFITKVQARRGRCRIGLLFGASGFTSDARHQELKLAMTDIVIVLIEPDELVEWIDSDEPDNCLEGFVRRAMLR